MDNNNLYEGLGIDRNTTKSTSNNVTTTEGKIKKEINQVVHDFLLKTYPQYYKNLDTTTIIKQDKTGDVDGLSDISGYTLLVPIDGEGKIKNGNNKMVLAHALKVADPQIYLKGIKNHVCEFVKIGGNTHFWDKKSNNFTQTK